MNSRSRGRKQPSTARRLAVERLESRALLAVLFEQGPSDPVRVLVPPEEDYGDLGFDWTGVAEPFDDAAWTVVSGNPNGVGYDRGSGAYDSAIGLDVEASMYEESTTLFARATFDVENATAVGRLTLRLRYDDAFIAWINGVEVARTNTTGVYPMWDARALGEFEAPLTPAEFDISQHVSLLHDGANVLAIRLLNDSPTGDDALLKFTLTGETREGPPQAVNDVAQTSEGQPVTINVLANDREGSDDIDPATVTIVAQPQHGSASVNADGTITYTPNGIYNGPDTFAYTVRDDSPTGQPGNRTLIATNSPVRALVPANDNLGVTWRGQNPNFDDSTWQSGTFGVGYDTTTSPVDYNPFLGLNVAAMRNVNSTLYMRSAFTLDDPASVETLTLRIRYDDGFVAFLNGVQIVARNSPGFLTYNSPAPSGDRTDTLSLNYETFDLIAYRDALKTGKNILAIHGLNQQIDSSDLLMQPELTAFVNPRGRISNPATVNINVASVEYSPIANDDNYTVDEGESLIVGGTGSPDLTPGPGQTLWPTASGGNGRLYRPVVASGGITWREAHDAARAAGGKLASISSQAENEFVYQLISGSQYWSTVNNDYFGPWLGGFQAGVPGSTTWKWLSGDSFAFTSWAPTEPIGSGELQNVFYFTPDPGIPRPTWADQVWNGTLRPSSYVIEWDVAPDDRVSLVPEGATWRYRDNGAVPSADAQGDTWKEHDYDDANWSTGIAEFGFGDGDEGTVVSCGPTNPTCNQNNNPTTWFRRHFTLTPNDRARFESLYLEFVRDDGIAVYINGIEVARDQLPGTLGDSSVTAATFASGTAAQADELTFQPPVILDLSAPSWSNLLRDGDNVIAVEVHQDRANSSDLSFDLHLAATLDKSTGLLANDIERDNQPMTAILVSGPTHGTLDFGSDGTFEYVPNPGFTGVDTFTYRASDGTLLSEPAIVTITVNHLPPTARSDSYVTNEDTTLAVPASLGVLANDTDTLAHPLTAVLETSPAHGTLALATNGSFHYTPVANYFGSDTFTYRAGDGALASPLTTVTITINPVNDAPVALPDTYSIGQGQTLSPAPPINSYAEAVLSAGPLAYWRLGESAGTTAFDLAGDFDGVYVGGVSLGRPGALIGDTNKSIDLDGQTGYVNVGSHAALDLRSDFSISAWFRPDDVIGDQRIVSNPNAEISTAGYAFGINANRLRFTTYTVQDYDTLPVISPGHWYHVAVVFDADYDATFYVNGEFFQKINGVAPAKSSLQPFKIGAGSRSTFDGHLDEVAMFDRTLTAAEIRAQYLAGIGVSGDANAGLLLDRNAVWKYRDDIANGSAYPIDIQGDRWTQSNYDDANWPSGSAILGYDVIDAGPIGTTIGFGGNVNDRNRTVLFRRAFQVEDASLVKRLVFRLLADDGASIYINGREVLRHNLPGTLGDATLTTNTLSNENGEEAVYVPFVVDPANFPGMLIDGANTIAVEIHQAHPASSDLGFDVSLVAVVDAIATSVLANDEDVEAASVSATLISAPIHGSLQFSTNGTFTYTPQADFSGVDAFTYRATDGQHFSEPTTVRIVVAPANKAPQDLNADGTVNTGDVAFLLASYGKSTAAKAIEGDFDGDGRIGVRDAIALRNAFTPVSAPAAAASFLARRSGENDTAQTEVDADKPRAERRSELRADRDVRRAARATASSIPAATDHVLANESESPLLSARRARTVTRTSARTRT